MATKLNKDISRESSETIEDKEIVITLTEGQEVELKVKGSRGNGKSINIKDLYNQLYNIDDSDINIKGKKSVSIIRGSSDGVADRKLISLYDLRSQNAISMLTLTELAKFDQIIKSVIDSYKLVDNDLKK